MDNQTLGDLWNTGDVDPIVSMGGRPPHEPRGKELVDRLAIPGKVAQGQQLQTPGQWSEEDQFRANADQQFLADKVAPETAMTMLTPGGAGGLGSGARLAVRKGVANAAESVARSPRAAAAGAAEELSGAAGARPQVSGGEPAGNAGRPGQAAPGTGSLGGVDYRELKSRDAGTFQKAISEAKDAHPAGAAVTVYPDYSGMRTFLAPDNKSGFALNGDDIVSVFRHPGSEHRGVVGPMLERAVQEGGRRLDAFDTKLPELYGNNGFKVIARTPFNEEFAPEGWSAKDFSHYNKGKPDVVAMAYDPSHGPYVRGEGEMVSDYDTMIAKQRDYVLRNSPGKGAMPQLAERYPEEGYGTPTLDKKKDKYFMEKTNSPEAEQLQKARAAAQEDMDTKGYQPYFNPEERFHADPSQHPEMLDTANQLAAKKETVEAWTKKLDTPETRLALQRMYKEGQSVPNAHNWYMMGQLEREYINEYGSAQGRKLFRENFAGAMAATTGGADPTANFLMAHYANYLRNKGQDFPRVTPMEQEQIKTASEAAGKSYVDAKGRPIDKTGDIASYKLPFPIGGQYAAGNLDQYERIFGMVDKGEDIAKALVKANPKRLDFMQSFLGHPDSFTWDKQMSQGAIGEDMPPTGTYGIMERMGREEAAKEGVPAQNYQDVAWAGEKKMKLDAKGKPFVYEGPMIQHINDAIERTHRVTGMPRSEIVRRGLVKGEIPMYSGIGALSAGAIANAVRQRQQQDTQ